MTYSKSVVRECLAWLICLQFTALVLLSTFAGAEEQVPQIAGMVSDSSGHPIENAIVRIVGEKQNLVPAYRSRGMVETKSDTNGRYTAQLQLHDLPLLANYQPKVKVIIWAQGYDPTILRLPATRLMADAPLNVKLTLANQCSVRVVGPDGNPLTNVTVAPAKIWDFEFAFGELDFLAASTDVNGVATIPGVTRSNLGQVYVHSPAIGHQSLELVTPDERGEDPLVVNTLPIQVMDTHLVAPDSLSGGHVDFDQVGVSFISRPNENAMNYLWQDAAVDKQGTIRGVRVTPTETTIRLDLPADFPFVAQRISLQRTGIQTDEALQPIQLVEANLVVGRVIDAETQRGLEGIYIDQFSGDWRLSFTDETGRFSYWVPAVPHTGFFPQDPLGSFISNRASYITPEGLPDESRVIQVPDERLVRMPLAVGKVVDVEGKPVEGAAVTVTQQKDRFTNSVLQYTNAGGQFRLFHIGTGTRVRLSAQTESEGTKDKLEVIAADDALPALQVSPVVMRTFSGRILDQGGLPVRGARVEFKRSEVVEQENYNGEFKKDWPLFDENTQIVTNDAGSFHSPPTAAEDLDVAFEVEARGYRKYHSPWIDLSGANKTKTAIELAPPPGGFRLQADGARVQCSVQIASANERLLHGLRFVALGAHAGLTKHVSKEANFKINLKNSPQIVAAIADDHQPMFMLLDNIPPVITFTLTPQSAPVEIAARQEHKSNDLENRIKLANRLLNHLKPVDENDTVYKRKLFFECLIFADPNRALEMVTSGKFAEFELILDPNYIPMTLTFIESLLQHVDDDLVVQGMKLKAAQLADDPQKAERYLEEAVAQLKELSGSKKAVATSNVARSLLRISQSDRAESLLRDTWSELTSAQEYVGRGRRLDEGRQYRGIALLFGPELALVDKRASMKLIELAAFANEISKVQSEAIVLLASQGKSEWQLVAHAFLDGKLDARGIMGYLRKTDFRNIPEGLKLIDMVDSAAVRSFLLLHMAEHPAAMDPAQRTMLLRRVEREIRLSRFSSGEPHPAQLAAKASSMAFESDPALSEAFFFEALWLGEGSNSIMPFDTLCRVADELAPHRPDVARHLIEPCVDDWSWLYLVRNSSLMFQGNRPLEVAGLIDSEWAVRLAEDLMEGQLTGRQSHRLATVYAIINSWARIELGMGRAF